MVERLKGSLWKVSVKSKFQLAVRSDGMCLGTVSQATCSAMRYPESCEFMQQCAKRPYAYKSIAKRNFERNSNGFSEDFEALK
jgi:hypothetical protein